ncbi:MAG: DUF3500 domain-containing protein, partial [Candidatus Dormibacteraeota bacterium]|nr:DUF3500 domain-containing protein [Candidatus Dormibacteraeota bacterium]
MTGLPPGYGPRPKRLALKRGAVDPEDAAGLAAVADLVGDAQAASVVECAAEPFVGVTTDGHPVPGLFELREEGAPAAAAVQAALGYLSSLDQGQRAAAVLPLDAPEWRLWINAFLTFPEHGLLLQELTDAQRTAALAVIEACLS